MEHRIRPYLLHVDRLGSFVLALQGASIAAVHGLDLLGVLVLASVSAMGGGIIRDVLIGAHPPEALRNWVIVTIAVAGGLLTFAAYHIVSEIPEALLLGIDAVGLSLLAVAGAEKALEYDLKGPVAVIMGGITGVGGGTMRDVLLAQVPAVLRVDFVASSALIGAAVLVTARYCKVPSGWAALMGGVTVFVLRLASALLHWQLPAVDTR